MEIKENKLLISAKESAGFLGISRSLFYELNVEGRVPAPIRLGKRVRGRRDELIAWVEADCPNRLEWDQIKVDRN